MHIRALIGDNGGSEAHATGTTDDCPDDPDTSAVESDAYDPDRTEPELDPYPVPAAMSPGREDIPRRSVLEPQFELAPEPEPEPEPEAEPEAKVETPQSGPGAVAEQPEPKTGAEQPTPEARFEPPEQTDGAHMSRRLTTRLGQLLLDTNLLSESQLHSALERQQKTGERLGVVLVNEGYIHEPALLSVLANQYGVPAANLDDIRLDAELAKLIPHEMARRYLLVPLALHDDAVDVAMVDPSDFVAMAHIRFSTGLRPNVFITTATAAQRAIASLYEEENFDTEEPPTDPREVVKRMILDRDSLLMAAEQDPRKFYELAASIDAFVDEIFRKASGSS